MANTKKTAAVDTGKKVQEVHTKQYEENTRKSDALLAHIAELEQKIRQLEGAAYAQSKPSVQRKNIKVVNLTPDTVVLKGSQIWRIEGQFSSRTFRENELEIIVNNMPGIIRRGSIYIADAQFVEEHDLEDVYVNLLDDAFLKNLLNADANTVIEAYKTCNDGQKKIIIAMLTEKVIKKESIDANILKTIGDLCGIDFFNMEALEPN